MAYDLKNLWIISYSEFSYARCWDLGFLEEFNFKLEFIVGWCKKKKLKKIQDKPTKLRRQEIKRKILISAFGKKIVKNKKKKKHSKALERFNLE